FNGLAQVMVQSERNGKGPLVLRATAADLRTAELVLPVAPTPSRPSVAPTAHTLLLRQWRRSPTSLSRPDPNQVVAANDMNSWSGVQPGVLQDFSAGEWAVYRVEF